jgi:hypothetical protein
MQIEQTALFGGAQVPETELDVAASDSVLAALEAPQQAAERAADAELPATRQPRRGVHAAE